MMTARTGIIAAAVALAAVLAAGYTATITAIWILDSEVDA